MKFKDYFIDEAFIKSVDLYPPPIFRGTQTDWEYELARRIIKAIKHIKKRLKRPSEYDVYANDVVYKFHKFNRLLSCYRVKPDPDCPENRIYVTSKILTIVGYIKLITKNKEFEKKESFNKSNKPILKIYKKEKE